MDSCFCRNDGQREKQQLMAMKNTQLRRMIEESIRLEELLKSQFFKIFTTKKKEVKPR
jgi:hypothetical protein